MELSPSWEANRFLDSQEITCILRNPKVYYRIHRRLPPAPILSQNNPVHVSPPTWRSSLIWSSHTRLGHLSCIQYVHPLGSAHYFLFDHSNDIRWGPQSIKLLLMYYSPLPCYLFPLRPKHLPQHSILEQPRPVFLPQCERPRFVSIQNNSSQCLSLHTFG
jgi:hypothetical protein